MENLSIIISPENPPAGSGIGCSNLSFPVHSELEPIEPLSVEIDLMHENIQVISDFISPSISVEEEIRMENTSIEISTGQLKAATQKKRGPYKQRGRPNKLKGIELSCPELVGKSGEEIARDPELKKIREKALSRERSKRYRISNVQKAIMQQTEHSQKVGKLSQDKAKLEYEVNILKTAIHSGVHVGEEVPGNAPFLMTPYKIPMAQASVSTPSPQVNRVERKSKSSRGKRTSSTKKHVPEQKQDGSLRFGPTVLKKFVSNFFNGALQVEDFKRVRFDSFGSPVWETLECSDSALKALTTAALDGLSCVQRALVGKAVVQFQTAVSSLLMDESANNKFAIWGHSSAKGERESRRHYAIKPSHRSNFRNQQLASLSLTSRAVLDLEGALAECNRAHDFLASKSSDIPDDPSLYVKSKLRYFAEHLATVNGWDLNDKFYALQFNYQHSQFFAPHIDFPGQLKENLLGGDGFGEQICIAQVRGSESWVFIASQVQGLIPPKYVGVKFPIRTGDAWSMCDKARYAAVHGVLSDCPRNVHTPSCFQCKMTASLRNGYGDPNKVPASLRNDGYVG